MESSIARSVAIPSDPDETTPLLAGGQPEGDRRGSAPAAPQAPGPAPPSQPGQQRPPSSPAWPAAAILCGALSLVADLGDGLTAAPEVRLLEMAVCRDYYRAHDPSLIGPPPLGYVREELCKRNEIQVELAYLRALKSLFIALPGLLCTVFFGRLADVWGRKPVLLMGMTGQIMSYLWVILICYFHEVFPTRLVWASAVFQFLGGGHRNITALMNTVIVDVAPETARTSTFYLVGALIRVTDMLSALGGSWLLSKDLWLPFKISTPVLVMSLPIIMLMPETLPPRAPQRQDSVIEESTDDEDERMAAKTKTTALSTLKAAVSALTSILRFSHATTPLLLCFTIIFLKTFALMSNQLYLQFASKALRWTIADAGYLLFIKALMSLFILLLLPLLGRAATRRHLPAVAVDTWVARGSLLFLALGSWLIGSASSATPASPGRGGHAASAAGGVVLIVVGLVLSSAGNGITQTMRGLVAHFAAPPPVGSSSSLSSSGPANNDGGGDDESSSDQEEEQSRNSNRSTGSNMGQLYAGIALLELAAVLTGNVAFAALFGLGTKLSSSDGGRGGSLGWGEGWLGLPFYAAGVMFFLGFVCATRVPVATTSSRR